MYKVLIVDDKSLIRKGVISAIQWKELHCELAGEAENGEHALAIIKKVRPEIVITDIRMPDMDGLELLKNISQYDNEIVRIVISGYDDFQYAKKAIKYGSIDYIMKPVDPAELNESLKKACLVLDKNKALTFTNEKLLKDLFQKAIKEIDFNPGEYQKIFDQYRLDQSMFCVAVFKYGKETLNLECSWPDYQINFLAFEEMKGMTTAVFFTKTPRSPVSSFELEVEQIVSDLFQEELFGRVVVGIGEIAGSLDQLSNTYRTACEAAFTSLLSKTQKITRYAWVSGRKPLLIAPEEFESELMINLTSGNPRNIKQILDGLFHKLLDHPDVTMESVRLLLRHLCYLLIKLDLDFKAEIDCFLEKLNYPGYMLKYESLRGLAEVIENFYDLAVQNFLAEVGGKASLINKVKQIVERNYSSQLGLKELADLLHVNPSYLTRIFKEQEGENIQAFLIRFRIEKAKKILEAGKIKIEKLAETVGYEDSTYFFKVFKKVTGMTPREYLLKSRPGENPTRET